MAAWLPSHLSCFRIVVGNVRMNQETADLTVRMKHEDDHGMNEDSNLSHNVRASKCGKQSRDDDTN